MLKWQMHRSLNKKIGSFLYIAAGRTMIPKINRSHPKSKKETWRCICSINDVQHYLSKPHPRYSLNAHHQVIWWRKCSISTCGIQLNNRKNWQHMQEHCLNSQHNNYIERRVRHSNRYHGIPEKYIGHTLKTCTPPN